MKTLELKKAELKKLVSIVLPSNDSTEYTFARKLIFHAWEQYTVADISFAITHYFPELTKDVNKILNS